MPKKIIVGCDGTWLNSDEGYTRKSYMPWAKKLGGTLITPSNVTRICRALQPGTGAVEHSGKTPSGNIQVVCYRAGVASSDNFWDRYVNGTTAADINSNIRDAYCALVENWEPGDDIFLIGFSRGSFVARMTSTLVYDIGILNKKGMEHWYDIFEDWAHKNRTKFKEWTNWSHALQEDKVRYAGKVFGVVGVSHYSTYSQQLLDDGFTRHDVPIKAVACWDTVGTRGIPRLIFTHKSMRPIGALLNASLGHFDKAIHLEFADNYILPNVHASLHALAMDEVRQPFTPTLWEIPQSRDPNTCILRQTWFPGTHGNVGGSVDDESLPELALMWMVGQLQELGLEFDDDYLRWCRKEARKRKHDMYRRARLIRDRNIAASPTKQTSLPRQPTGWALGSIYDVLDGSGAINKYGGLGPRTPGRFYRVGSNPKEPLLQTNEYIHPSVRTRRAVSHLHPHHVATDEVDGTYRPRTPLPPLPSPHSSPRLDMKERFVSSATNASAATTTLPQADNSATSSGMSDIGTTATPTISCFPPTDSAQDPSTQTISADADHLDEAYHQRYPHLKVARTYTPWNIHLHPNHKHTSTTTPPKKTAQAMYYDPPALDAYRLYHTADPTGQLRNWDKNGEEILATEWDPRVEGWKWVMVNDAADDVSGIGSGKGKEKKQGEKYLEEWTLTDVEKALLEELGVEDDA